MQGSGRDCHTIEVTSRGGRSAVTGVSRDSGPSATGSGTVARRNQRKPGHSGGRNRSPYHGARRRRGSHHGRSRARPRGSDCAAEGTGGEYGSANPGGSDSCGGRFGTFTTRNAGAALADFAFGGRGSSTAGGVEPC